MGLRKLNINTLYFIFIKYCAFQSYTQAKKITLLTGNSALTCLIIQAIKGGYYHSSVRLVIMGIVINLSWLPTYLPL